MEERKKNYSLLQPWLAILLTMLTTVECEEVPPPLPVMPLPTASQLRWQQREIIMFLHFGVNTFTDREWGTGSEDPAVFKPHALNASQWAETAKKAGISLLILTAKHHDGFCLWPSMYTNHSVQSSPWKDGHGDVVKEVSDSCRQHGLDLGVYLSPWDRHDYRYGEEKEYNEFYLGQLQELLTRYGPISEVWFDGAKGTNAPNMTYMFDQWFGTVHEMEIAGNVFSDAGPDVRWVGDESGEAGSTCWSTVNRTALKIGEAGLEGYLNQGDPLGTDWVPPECDVSIRDGWFWHKNEKPKSLSKLLEIYYKSVGRNCVLHLNVPPNTAGLISDDDVERLTQLSSALHVIFSNDVARDAEATASSVRGAQFSANNVRMREVWKYWVPRSDACGPHWVELASHVAMAFNVVRIEETIVMGQRVKAYAIFAGPVLIANGTTVGHKRLHRLDFHVAATSVRLVITDWKGEVPLISSFGLHLDPYYPKKKHDVECLES